MIKTIFFMEKSTCPRRKFCCCVSIKCMNKLG